MWKRGRYWILLIAVVGVALAAYFEPTRCVRGWLCGEAFFDGRPTSYWRGVVERDLQIDPRVFFMSPAAPPPPTFWERCRDWVGYRPATDSSVRLLQDDSAGPVLRQLQEDDNENVAGFATDAVRGVGRPIGEIEDPVRILWMALVCKHNMKHPDNDLFKVLHD
jgi:hypothetical protein